MVKVLLYGCPDFHFFSRRRKSSPDRDVDMSPGSDAGSDIRDDQEMDTMDEHMAAMVLTNLSCSPKSPQFPLGFMQDTGMGGHGEVISQSLGNVTFPYT